MNKVFSTAAAALLLFAMAASVYAQAPGTGRGQGQRQGGMDPQRMQQIRTDMEAARTRVLGSLGLSNEQKTKIANLDAKFKTDNQKAMQEMQAARQSGDQAKMQAARQKTMELGQKHRADVNAVLTAQQRQSFQTKMLAEIDKIAEKYQMDKERLRQMWQGGGRGQGQRPGGGRQPA